MAARSINPTISEWVLALAGDNHQLIYADKWILDGSDRPTVTTYYVGPE
jgi:hypothetical protein